MIRPMTLIKDLSQKAGAEATIAGWLLGKRSGGKVAFLLVRDGTGVCQCIAEAGNPDVFSAAGELTQESSLEVSGTVRSDARAPGGCEIAVSDIRVLQKAEDYPISRKAHGVDFLMSHRHLWLRSQRQAAILRIRHTVIKASRSFFDNRDFTLVDMPILTPGVGEDAKSLFSVDYYGEKVFLAQTGQLYLESACMALRKVYCFGPTFRAEKSKTRRHLSEFWMIEPEIAFAELDDVVALAEDMVCSIVDAVLAGNQADLALVGRDIAPLMAIRKPFPRITYTEAAEMLRSEKTAKWLIDELERDRAEFQKKVKELATLDQRLAQAAKGPARDRLQDQASELREEIHDLEADLAARPEHIRLAGTFEWGKDLGGSDETIISRMHDRPVFVTDYPKEAKAFYMKVADGGKGRTVRNMDLLAPEGYGEIIGGSQREEDPEVLVARIREVGLDPANYAWYLDLRRYGSVPHGGFGLGIERTLSWICGLRHVREAIPFPRMMARMDM
ncbi:MAG: amino acid--tRNA ligase-related protein [bacterium]